MSSSAEAEVSSEAAFTRSRESLGASWRRSWQALRRGRAAERGAAGRRAPPRSATEYAVAAIMPEHQLARGSYPYRYDG